MVSGLALTGTLVNCIRMMAMESLLDFNGHVSVRLLDDRLLINSRCSPSAGINSDQIVMTDMDCNLIEGDDEPPSEMIIHTETCLLSWRSLLGAVRSRLSVRAPRKLRFYCYMRLIFPTPTWIAQYEPTSDVFLQSLEFDQHCTNGQYELWCIAGKFLRDIDRS